MGEGNPHRKHRGEGRGANGFESWGDIPHLPGHINWDGTPSTKGFSEPDEESPIEPTSPEQEPTLPSTEDIDTQNEEHKKTYQAAEETYGVLDIRINTITNAALKERVKQVRAKIADKLNTYDNAPESNEDEDAALAAIKSLVESSEVVNALKLIKIHEALQRKEVNLPAAEDILANTLGRHLNDDPSTIDTDTVIHNIKTQLDNQPSPSTESGSTNTPQEPETIPKDASDNSSEERLELTQDQAQMKAKARNVITALNDHMSELSEAERQTINPYFKKITAIETAIDTELRREHHQERDRFVSQSNLEVKFNALAKLLEEITALAESTKDQQADYDHPDLIPPTEIESDSEHADDATLTEQAEYSNQREATWDERTKAREHYKSVKAQYETALAEHYQTHRGSEKHKSAELQQLESDFLAARQARYTTLRNSLDARGYLTETETGSTHEQNEARLRTGAAKSLVIDAAKKSVQLRSEAITASRDTKFAARLQKIGSFFRRHKTAVKVASVSTAVGLAVVAAPAAAGAAAVGAGITWYGRSKAAVLGSSLSYMAADAGTGLSQKFLAHKENKATVRATEEFSVDNLSELEATVHRSANSAEWLQRNKGRIKGASAIAGGLVAGGLASEAGYGAFPDDPVDQNSSAYGTRPSPSNSYDAPSNDTILNRPNNLPVERSTASTLNNQESATVPDYSRLTEQPAVVHEDVDASPRPHITNEITEDTEQSYQPASGPTSPESHSILTNEELVPSEEVAQAATPETDVTTPEPLTLDEEHVSAEIVPAPDPLPETTTPDHTATPETAELIPTHAVVKGDTLWDITKHSYAAQLEGLTTEQQNTVIANVMNKVQASDTLLDTLGVASGDIDLIRYDMDTINPEALREVMQTEISRFQPEGAVATEVIETTNSAPEQSSIPTPVPEQIDSALDPDTSPRPIARPEDVTAVAEQLNLPEATAAEVLHAYGSTEAFLAAKDQAILEIVRSSGLAAAERIPINDAHSVLERLNDILVEGHDADPTITTQSLTELAHNNTLDGRIDFLQSIDVPSYDKYQAALEPLIKGFAEFVDADTDLLEPHMTYGELFTKYLLENAPNK